MDVNNGIVFIEYINQYLNDILLNKLFLNANFVFLLWGLMYFVTIFGYFYGHYTEKTPLYHTITQFYLILCTILVLFIYNISLQSNIISFKVIYWIIGGVFIHGYNFIKNDFLDQLYKSVIK